MIRIGNLARFNAGTLNWTKIYFRFIKKKTCFCSWKALFSRLITIMVRFSKFVDHDKSKFEKGQMDSFEICSKNLGELRRIR
jgi:hypothetical protein